MADPSEFMLMTQVREGDTDRPDDFVGATAPTRKEKPKKKWASGDTSGTSRVGDWLGAPGGGTPKRSWKVKDLSKSTLADLEAKETDGASSTVSASSSSSNSRRWKPPPKNEAALPPWMSSSTTFSSTSSSRPLSKWALKKHNPPPPPVNRPSPVEHDIANDTGNEASSRAVTDEQQEISNSRMDSKGEILNPEEFTPASLEVVDSVVSALTDERTIDVSTLSACYEQELPPSPDVIDTRKESESVGNCEASEVSSHHEAVSETDASENYEVASEGESEDEEVNEIMEPKLDESSVHLSEDISMEETKDADSPSSPVHVLTGKKESSDVDPDNGEESSTRPSDCFQKERGSISEKHEVESECEMNPQEDPQEKPFEQKKIATEKPEVFAGPDPNEFKVMTMVRDGETDRPDDFVGSIGRSHTKKDAPKKRWGSTTSAGGGRVDDWLGAPGGGKSKRSWKVKS